MMPETSRRSSRLLALAGLLLTASVWNSPAQAQRRAKRDPFADQIPNLPVAPKAWKDVAGKTYDLSVVKGHKATVFFFSSTQCPIANIYTPRMVEAAKKYAPRGVQFFLVNSNKEDSLAAVRQYAAERHFAFPAVKDNGTQLADDLNANYTPEAIVLDSQAVIRYRGRIDDNQDRARIIRHDLAEALDAVLAGRPVARPRTLVTGCTIFRDETPKANAQVARVTYARDVAPILFANCVSCHRTGEVAPNPLETYAQAKTWAGAIKRYTARRQMPPWKAVPGYGDFHDAHVLTDKQIATLAAWADSGAPQGDPKLTPALPPAPNGGWALGKPDLVLASTEAYPVPAEGRDVYRQFILPYDTNADSYVRGVVFQADNRALVHHMILYLDLSGMSVEMDKRDPGPGYSVANGNGGIGVPFDKTIFLSGWAPGNNARLMPEGMAARIPKGAKLVLQVHYHQNGKEQLDRSRVGLYFADERKVEKEVFTGAVASIFLNLKPGLAKQVVEANHTLYEDTEIVAVSPHMHMLGREMKLTANLPDGKAVPMIYIDDWNFNWQETYRYKKPLELPKGTRIHLYASYDNSERNPRQPSHPPRRVTWGEETTDEMCIGFYVYTKKHVRATTASATP